MVGELAVIVGLGVYSGEVELHVSSLGERHIPR